MAKEYRIHPAIGFARVGTSLETFLAPELPGHTAAPAGNTFRDANGELKRQAVRFRVFETDTVTGAIRELTVGSGGVTKITWTVHLKNKKAVWFVFDGIRGEGPGGYLPNHPLRNDSVTVDRDKKLIIDPGPRTLAATGAAASHEIAKGTGPAPAAEAWPPPLNGGAKKIETLGTLSVDADGRLTVAGGFGVSGTSGAMPGGGLLHYANNDEWFDDTSDGSVTASVEIADMTIAALAPAWVAVGPPDYAPPVANIVTVHDLLEDLSLRHFDRNPAIFGPLTAGGVKAFLTSFKPTFAEHVWPIIERAYMYRWVVNDADRHFTPSTPTGMPKFPFAAMNAQPVAGETPTNNPRLRVFRKLRNPDAPTAGGIATMPKLKADGVDGTDEDTIQFTLTRFQYFCMKQWSDGQFISSPGPAAPATAVTPAGLDRASMDAACGGSFFPGMEIGWTLRDPRVYVTPFEFRFRVLAAEGPTGLTPGDASKRMALPWQADFLKCGDHWWPAQRPNDVFRGAVRENWDLNVASHVHLTDVWSQLGIVAADPADPSRCILTERLLPPAT